MQSRKLKVKRWGNSVGLLIPKSVAAAIGLEIDTQVVARYRPNEFSVHPIPQYDLISLLKDVTPSDMPRDDWDAPLVQTSTVDDR